MAKQPMTITEKIFSKHAGLESVKAGDLITAKVDITLANDITGPVAIKEFKKIGAEKVFDKTRTVFVPDHFVPNKDIKSAEQAKYMREFVKEQGITNYFEVGRMGIEHALLPDMGIVCSGDLILGADSHTCTYGAIGAFSTGVGSTDLACAMASGETWLKVPPTIKVSADIMYWADLFKIFISSASSYKTTSGFISPPHSHLGTSLELSIYSAS